MSKADRNPETTSLASKSAAGRAARQRRAAAERSRLWRERNAALKRPVARVVDAAIVEALAFCIARAQRDGVNIGETGAARAGLSPVDVTQLARIAALVLEREGYEPAVAMTAVAKRIKRRETHTWHDHVPSLDPGPPERIRETKAGPWRTAMATVLDIIRPRSPSRP